MSQMPNPLLSSQYLTDPTYFLRELEARKGQPTGISGGSSRKPLTAAEFPMSGTTPEQDPRSRLQSASTVGAPKATKATTSTAGLPKDRAMFDQLRNAAEAQYRNEMDMLKMSGLYGTDSSPDPQRILQRYNNAIRGIAAQERMAGRQELYKNRIRERVAERKAAKAETEALAAKFNAENEGRFTSANLTGGVDAAEQKNREYLDKLVSQYTPRPTSPVPSSPYPEGVAPPAPTDMGTMAQQIREMAAETPTGQLAQVATSDTSANTRGLLNTAARGGRAPSVLETIAELVNAGTPGGYETGYFRGSSARDQAAADKAVGSLGLELKNLAGIPNTNAGAADPEYNAKMESAFNKMVTDYGIPPEQQAKLKADLQRGGYLDKLFGPIPPSTAPAAAPTPVSAATPAAPTQSVGVPPELLATLPPDQRAAVEQQIRQRQMVEEAGRVGFDPTGYAELNNRSSGEKLLRGANTGFDRFMRDLYNSPVAAPFRPGTGVLGAPLPAELAQREVDRARTPEERAAAEARQTQAAMQGGLQDLLGGIAAGARAPMGAAPVSTRAQPIVDNPMLQGQTAPTTERVNPFQVSPGFEKGMKFNPRQRIPGMGDFYTPQATTQVNPGQPGQVVDMPVPQGTARTNPYAAGLPEAIVPTTGPMGTRVRDVDPLAEFVPSATPVGGPRPSAPQTAKPEALLPGFTRADVPTQTTRAPVETPYVIKPAPSESGADLRGQGRLFRDLPPVPPQKIRNEQEMNRRLAEGRAAQQQIARQMAAKTPVPVDPVIQQAVDAALEKLIGGTNRLANATKRGAKGVVEGYKAARAEAKKKAAK